MTFWEDVQRLKARIDERAQLIDNEEATKLSLIFPMLEAWGYDPSDPSEVRVEYPIRLPNGGRGRADCVIMLNGKPSIIIECKSVEVELGDGIIEQLRQYVQATNATAGIATNGIHYRCYADTEEVSRMDDRPFLDVKLTDIDEPTSNSLALFSKDKFSPDHLRATATPIRQQVDSKSAMREMLLNSAVASDIEHLSAIADRTQRTEASHEFADWLQTVISELVEDIAENGHPYDGEPILTYEEYDSFLMIKGILHGTIEPDRVKHRDGHSYFSVLADNNRRPICRLYYNGRIKHVGTFDADKQETRHQIDDLDDLLGLASKLRRTARRYAES